MTEDQAELGEIPPVMRVLVEHFLFAFFEEFDGLFALSHEVNNKYVEVLDVVQNDQVVFVFRVDVPEPLVCIR